MPRRALITGSTRGIGRASAVMLAEAGYHVIVTGRSGPDAERTAGELRGAGLEAVGIGMDVADPASVDRAGDQIEEFADTLDALVNNAGVLPEAVDMGEKSFVTPKVLEETFRVNTFGPAHVIERFLPLVRRATAGRIVNVSTTMGSLSEQLNPDSPYYGMVVPAYQASKAALNSFTIGLSKLLAETPVSVTSICPGFVRTNLAPAAREAPTTPQEAARVVVRAAMLPSHEPSGQFFDAAGAVAW